MKKIKMLVPSLVNDFKCIGDKCEDNCCSGWRINIDKSTYKKYKKVADKDMKVILEKNIKRNKKSTNDFDYARIKLNEEGECPLMLSNKLCSIHKNLGDKFLCNVCKTYPRSYNTVNGIVEKHIVLSCPEAARIVLLNENGLDFYYEEYIEEELNNEVINYKNINLEKLSNHLAKYFWELRIFSIDLLQNRKFSIEERLIILGLFVNKINSNTTYDEVINLINKFQINISNGAFDNVLSSFDYNYKYNLEFVSHMNDCITNKKNTNYSKIIEKTIEGLKFKEEGIDSYELYKNATKNEYKNFEKSYQYILENYLVHDIYKSLFPINKNNIFDSYVVLIVKFALVKLNLIGVSQYNKSEITKEDAVSIISSLTRCIDHNSIVVDNIVKYLEVNELKSLAHMVSLIGE